VKTVFPNGKNCFASYERNLDSLKTTSETPVHLNWVNVLFLTFFNEINKLRVISGES